MEHASTQMTNHGSTLGNVEHASTTSDHTRNDVQRLSPTMDYCTTIKNPCSGQRKHALNNVRKSAKEKTADSFKKSPGAHGGGRARSAFRYRDKEIKERGKAEKRLCALARLSGFRHTFLNDGYKDRTGRASAHRIFLRADPSIALPLNEGIQRERNKGMRQGGKKALRAGAPIRVSSHVP